MKCKLCGDEITRGVGAWESADGIGCPTTTGEITGHLPEVTA